MTFYMGYYRSRPREVVPYAEANDIGLLTNASSRWSTRTNRFNKLWDYDCPHIVDPGGYTVLNNHGEYPWTVAEYHEWLSEYSDRFTWAAVMDYVTGEEFDDLYSVDERIEKTFENTLELFNNDPDYPVLPVLQARDLEGYIEFYDRLVDHGIPVEYVGLGSVTDLPTTEVAAIERALRQRCPRIERIHGFGIKAAAFRSGVSFDTVDSQVWVQAKTHGMVYRLDGDELYKEPLEDPVERTLESFKNYHKYATRLMEQSLIEPSGQTSLTDFKAY